MFTHLGLDVASKLRCVSPAVVQAILNLPVPRSAGKRGLLPAAHGMPVTRARELPGLQTHSWTAQTPPVSLFLLTRSLKKLSSTDISPSTRIIFKCDIC